MFLSVLVYLYNWNRNFRIKRRVLAIYWCSLRRPSVIWIAPCHAQLLWYDDKYNWFEKAPNSRSGLLWVKKRFLISLNRHIVPVCIQFCLLYPPWGKKPVVTALCKLYFQFILTSFGSTSITCNVFCPERNLVQSLCYHCIQKPWPQKIIKIVLIKSGVLAHFDVCTNFIFTGPESSFAMNKSPIYREFQTWLRTDCTPNNLLVNNRLRSNLSGMR